MNLTPAQLLTLKNSIAADPTLGQLPHTTDNAFAVAAAYNLDASPAFTVWKMLVQVQEIEQNGFVWSAVDSLTAGKARIWEWMRSSGTIRPFKANVRQGLADAFGAGSAMGTAILPHLKRLAKRWEQLYAVGTGTNGSPATLPDNFTEGGTITFQDVETAWNLEA